MTPKKSRIRKIIVVVSNLVDRTPISVVLFTMAVTFIYLSALSYHPLWWGIVAGVALFGTGYGVVSDFKKSIKEAGSGSDDTDAHSP